MADSSIIRIRPRTELGFGVEPSLEIGRVGGSSRIHTAALSDRPEPRRMAGRPVDWIVDIMAEGGAVPVVVSIDLGTENDVDWIPKVLI